MGDSRFLAGAPVGVGGTQPAIEQKQRCEWTPLLTSECLVGLHRQPKGAGDGMDSVTSIASKMKSLMKVWLLGKRHIK